VASKANKNTDEASRGVRERDMVTLLPHRQNGRKGGTSTGDYTPEIKWMSN
jgi:hypothetical protein